MTLAISERIRRVHVEGCGDPRHRYRSWAHCHAHFQVEGNRKTDDASVRLACLHLGFYLASWGMYRGSSFLLQKDYLVHEPAVRLLFAPEYRMLWSCDDRILAKDEEVTVQVFNLAGKIKYAYLAEFRNSHTGRREKNSDDISNTLVTKVLLGTMGCCTAYDRYFVNGAKGTIKPVRFGIRSLKSVVELIVAHSTDFLALQDELAKGDDGVRYPLMKLVDMGFWQKGFEEACIAEIQEAIQDDKKHPLTETAKEGALSVIGEAKKDIAVGRVVQAARRVEALSDDVRRLLEKTAAYRYFKSRLEA